MKLNLGSGSTKIPGYINIDREGKCKPDVILDFVKTGLPYKVNSVDEILIFHCLEHIQKEKHWKILTECSRVLKVGGKIYLSYPNFWECANHWKNNTAGLKKFWEATIYGRQLYSSDYHICIVDTDELSLLLYDCGFDEISSRPEPEETFNTITTATKYRIPNQTYEQCVANDLKRMVVRPYDHSHT